MPLVSIVISTRNRRDDVLVAIESCVALEYDSLEVLVYDDASTDGTAEAVAAQFPEVQLHTSPTREGYLVWRNRGFRDATGEFVISIDDDAYFTDARTIDRIVALFADYPHAGALALPYVEPRRDDPSAMMPPLEVGRPVRSYTGCAHAVRRDLAVSLGGYPEFLIHQGEERDLCLRMLDAGYSTLYADTPPIVHLYSPRREHDRVDYYGYRNTLLFTGLLAPASHVGPRLLMDSLQLLKHRFRWKTLPKRVQAILAGWTGIWSYRSHRRPVSRQTYAEYRRRPGHGPTASNGGLAPLTRTSSTCTNC